MDSLTTCDATLVWSCACLLGEGPIWLPDKGHLWFVDIKLGLLLRLDTRSDERQSFELGGSPSFVVPMADGALLVGNGHKLDRVENGAVTETLAEIVMPAHNRTNDATVDREGRLWFGTMDNEETASTGRVYRYDGTLIEVGGGCTITNGPAVSPDGRWLYHVDTLAGIVWRFDIETGGPALDHGVAFVRIDPADGNPDGVTVDSDGCLWVALWGGWCVRRYGPDGALLATVRLPCANVTKVAFGGPDLRTGYVTTARVGLTEQELAVQPEAGGLFRFDASVPGIPATPLRLH